MTTVRIDAPLSFRPLFMERVWGGRRMATDLGKRLPPALICGESWEIVDRPEAQSVIAGGVFAGRTVHDLWCEETAAVFGLAAPTGPVFPLLCKILDARTDLSVQVHPPAAVAAAMGGEPKTEMWYLAGADPGAALFAGLKEGATQAAFEAALAAGTVADCIHRLPVKRGDAIFIPSGRLHAVGAGCLIVEIQQNSDTTYRVFDWNRPGLDGRPRALHIAESLRSIDFADFEPGLAAPAGETLVECEYFRVEKWSLAEPREGAAPGSFAIFTCLEGAVRCGTRTFGRGEFFLLPAAMADRTVAPGDGPATLLRSTLPS